MITTGISSHEGYLLEEKGVRLLSVSLLSGEDLYYLNIHAMVCFFLTQKQTNWKFKHLAQTKLMGENNESDRSRY